MSAKAYACENQWCFGYIISNKECCLMQRSLLWSGKEVPKGRYDLEGYNTYGESQCYPNKLHDQL